jgi:hypothetical protein
MEAPYPRVRQGEVEDLGDGQGIRGHDNPYW